MSSWTTAPLAQRVGAGADAAQIADATVATWRDIEAALAPVVGQRGVAGLYRRSLFLATATHPWLAGTHDVVLTEVDTATLRSHLAQQSEAEAAAGATTFFQTFHALLSTLVGPSLTERLLAPVWAASSRAATEQDTAP